MLVISILLVAIGVSLYMGVKLVNMPMEGMTHAISEKILKKLPFHDVKVIMDCLSVGIGIVLSFVFLGKLEGIREEERGFYNDELFTNRKGTVCAGGHLPGGDFYQAGGRELLQTIN